MANVICHIFYLATTKFQDVILNRLEGAVHIHDKSHLTVLDVSFPILVAT